MPKTPSFKDMTGKELVAAYNAMVTSPAGKALGQPRNRPVGKFKTSDIGIKRCEAMASSLKAVAGAAKVDKRKEPRAGSKRQKLINRLLKSEGKQVSRDALLRAVYGSTDEKNRGPLLMCMWSMVKVDLEKRKLPYNLIKGKKGKEPTFGLHSKG